MFYFIDRNYCFKEERIFSGMNIDIFNLSRIKVVFLPFVIDNYNRAVIGTYVLKENKRVFLQYDKSKGIRI